jgi:hypothetical protein
MAVKRYFQCTTNRNAPVLVLEAWEGEAMKTHPDYVEIDADGQPIPDPKADWPVGFPLTQDAPKPAAKRPTLGLPKRK